MLAEENHSRTRRDAIVEKVEHLRRVFYRLRQHDFLHRNSITLRLELPGLLAARMLLVGHQHFIAGFHGDAVGDVVVRLGGVAYQRNLVPVTADEVRQGIAIFVPRPVAPDGIVFGIGLVELLGRSVAVEDGTQHRRRARPDGPVVEVDLILGNQELLAQLGPVSLVVVDILLRVGQRRRRALQLRQEIITKSESGGQSGSVSEKAAAIEQNEPPSIGKILHPATAFLRRLGVYCAHP